MAGRPEKSNSGSKRGGDADPIWKAGRFSWNLRDRALVMAVLNVTPDSFSDGGVHFRLEDTLRSASRFVAEGADLLDVGGESTRPGAAEVDPQEELERVQPVIEQLSHRGEVAISVDTRKASVAAAALQAGADVVNDITGFRDPAMLEACGPSDCGMVVMHMQGTPRTMQKNPSYPEVIEDITAFFEERFEALTRAGIAPERLVFDPGIGFGKTLAHNLALIHGLPRFGSLGRPVLIGLSRKSFLGTLLGRPEIEAREVPTQALTCLSRSRGAMIHRVHQVRECREALRMTEALHAFP